MVYLPSPDSRPSKCSSCTYLKMVISPCQDIFFCDVVMTRLWCHTNKGEVRVRCRSPVVETIFFRKKNKKKRQGTLHMKDTDGIQYEWPQPEVPSACCLFWCMFTQYYCQRLPARWNEWAVEWSRQSWRMCLNKKAKKNPQLFPHPGKLRDVYYLISLWKPRLLVHRLINYRLLMTAKWLNDSYNCIQLIIN